LFTICSSSWAGPNLVFFGETTFEADYSGDLKILGQVKNIGDLGANFIKINFIIYDAAGRVIDTEYTYVKGTCVNLDLYGSLVPTGTALVPGDVGFFEVYTDAKAALAALVDVQFSYDTYAMRPMDARLALEGPVNAQSDYFGDLKLLGQVKNIGAKGLIFGEVFFAVKDAAGRVIDTDSGYIKGENVFLKSIGSYTDTALNIGSIGVYDIWTLVDFNRFHALDFRGYWQDAVIKDGVVVSSVALDLAAEFQETLSQVDPADPAAEKLRHRARNARIDRLKALLAE
jgi:hypothetical protein